MGPPSAWEWAFQGFEVAIEDVGGGLCGLGRMSWGQKTETCQCNCSGRTFANSSTCRNILSKTSLALWELTGNYMWRFKMNMKLRFRASQEHADNEGRCTVDLKHALVTTPMMLRMRMLPILLPEATCRRWHGQTACEPARGVVNYQVSCDWRFQPSQYLAKARGTSASRS